MIPTSQNEDLRTTWFGKASPDWKLARAKNAFRITAKKVGQRSLEYNLLSLTLRGIIPRTSRAEKVNFQEILTLIRKSKNLTSCSASSTSTKRLEQSECQI